MGETQAWEVSSWAGEFGRALDFTSAVRRRQQESRLRFAGTRPQTARNVEATQEDKPDIDDLADVPGDCFGGRLLEDPDVARVNVRILSLKTGSSHVEKVVSHVSLCPSLTSSYLPKMSLRPANGAVPYHYECHLAGIFGRGEKV